MNQSDKKKKQQQEGAVLSLLICQVEATIRLEYQDGNITDDAYDRMIHMASDTRILAYKMYGLTN